MIPSQVFPAQSSDFGKLTPALFLLYLLSPYPLHLIHQLLLQKVSQILHQFLSLSLASSQAKIHHFWPSNCTSLLASSQDTWPCFLQSGLHTGADTVSLLCYVKQNTSRLSLKLPIAKRINLNSPSRTLPYPQVLCYHLSCLHSLLAHEALVSLAS